MKNLVITGVKLFAICAVAALTLGGIDAVTEPVIRQRKILELQQALEELTPDAETGQPVEAGEDPVVKAVYPVTAGGEQVGYVLELKGSGYGGDLRILARYRTDGSIVAAKLMEDLETPGLGKKAENPAYMDKFIGTGSEARPVPVGKVMLDPAESDAVTGATITFLGISKALAAGAEFVRTMEGSE
jgi:electron transport complex protein RnfG